MTIAKAVKKPHVLVVPYPAQGHVTPLMKLSHLIAKRGIMVTFVNTEYIHNTTLKSSSAIPPHDDQEVDNIVLASIPDGLAPEDDRNGFKLFESLRNTMARSLIDLIREINYSDSNEKISCVIADATIGWILEIAKEMGAEPVAFMPAAAASLAVIVHIPKLMEQGNLDANGSVQGTDIITLSKNIPPWRKDELTWSFPTDLNTQKLFFECCRITEKTANSAKWLLCNTFHELESSACDLNPKLLHIGPLDQINHINSSFHAQDTSCLAGLDQKPRGSVVYVSFGSLAVLSQHQLDELALGLELAGRPFLWVVRSNLANGSPVKYPSGFLERCREVGYIVEWAPQDKVLAHPSVGCFLSHCGWNSTLEGIYSGVPFLCWPFLWDQFHNANYVCDVWRNGLRIRDDGGGVRSRYEIEEKIGMVFGDVSVKATALRLKEMARRSVDRGGSSSENFERFIDHLKE